jgi:hypothetical protein
MTRGVAGVLQIETACVAGKGAQRFVHFVTGTRPVADLYGVLFVVCPPRSTKYRPSRLMQLS